jgi:hypothetical protein
MTESIGNLYTTAVPSLSDTADIQEALRVYHYGLPSSEFSITETNPENLLAPSVARSLYLLQAQIDNFQAGVLPSAYTDKGVLISASQAGTPRPIIAGANGQVLTTNSATETGLEWSVPEVTLTNIATLTNKTLSLATLLNSSVNISGLRFDGPSGNSFGTTLIMPTPTANKTVLFPATATIPLESTTLVGTDTIQTLSNKTLQASVGFVTSLGVQILTVNNSVDGSIELGRRDTVASSPYIDFHSGGSSPAPDYDVRIISTGGSSIAGRGTLRIDGNLVNNLNVTPKVQNYAFVVSDFNTIVQMNGAFAFQLNNTLSTATPGTQITLLARTTGVSVAAGSGVTLLATPGNKLRAAGSMATLLCLGTNSWVLTGDLMP